MSEEKWESPYKGKHKFYYGSSSMNAWCNDLCHKANLENERKARDPKTTEKNLEWHKASVARQIITPREAYGSTTMGASGGNYGEPMEVSLVKTARSNTSALGKKIRKSKRVKQLIQNNFGEEFASLKQQLDQAVAGRRESNQKLKVLVKLAGEIRQQNSHK
jgi:hypothetical protein